MYVFLGPHCCLGSLGLWFVGWLCLLYVKKHLWLSTCDNCLSGSVLLHSKWYFLTPSICPQTSRCHFFSCCVVLHCVYYHIFLIHSLVEGHLSCFQVLTILKTHIVFQAVLSFPSFIFIISLISLIHCSPFSVI